MCIMQYIQVFILNFCVVNISTLILQALPEVYLNQDITAISFPLLISLLVYWHNFT